ncbi:hypothetical protein TrVFT333_008320 [Trichoderma virens FT-333]|nr:hypothetical protein TrVFT333_008320 [Trichoderma virens FT-333]
MGQVPPRQACPTYTPKGPDLTPSPVVALADASFFVLSGAVLCCPALHTSEFLHSPPSTSIQPAPASRALQRGAILPLTPAPTPCPSISGLTDARYSYCYLAFPAASAAATKYTDRQRGVKRTNYALTTAIISCLAHHSRFPRHHLDIPLMQTRLLTAALPRPSADFGLPTPPKGKTHEHTATMMATRCSKHKQAPLPYSRLARSKWIA